MGRVWANCYLKIDATGQTNALMGLGWGRKLDIHKSLIFNNSLKYIFS